MTAEELRDIFVSAEYRRELEEMSSYLASIKQERPVIYSLAKCLWKNNRERVFQLEDKKRDLVVDGTHLEFKYHFDCDIANSGNELKVYQNKSLKAMWDDVLCGKLSKTWKLMPQLYGDMCIKRVHSHLADIFVWVICSRDLSAVSPDARKRICWSIGQDKWSKTHPYSDRGYLTVADSFLDRLQVERPFSVLKEAIETNGSFPSTYHFIICDFSKSPRA